MGNRDRHYRTLQTMVIVGRITLPLGVGGRLSVQVVRLAAGFAQARRSENRPDPPVSAVPRRFFGAKTLAKRHHMREIEDTRTL